MVLYGTSWLLRGAMPEHAHAGFMFLLLTLITFCTSVFRLALNKRFFDIANATNKHEYIYIKSYISPFFLALSAAVGAMMFSGTHTLFVLYMAAAPLSLIYLFYQGVPFIDKQIAGQQKS